jgi:hypothetical protein
MSSTFKALAVVVMVAVVAVLLTGLRNMMKGGSGNFSNKMMQLRVLLQFIAILFIVGALYFSRHG